MNCVLKLLVNILFVGFVFLCGCSTSVKYENELFGVKLRLPCKYDLKFNTNVFIDNENGLPVIVDFDAFVSGGADLSAVTGMVLVYGDVGGDPFSAISIRVISQHHAKDINNAVDFLDEAEERARRPNSFYQLINSKMPQIVNGRDFLRSDLTLCGDLSPCLYESFVATDKGGFVYLLEFRGQKDDIKDFERLLSSFDVCSR